MNWNDPAERLALIERVGPKAYNEAHLQHMKDETIDTINGHAIRPVQSRFGRLFVVGTTGKAFSTIDDAKKFATTA
jgi:hypothetical protein